MSLKQDLQLLQLMRLVSPALPVGAFAYSQGLEGAIEQSWVSKEAQAKDWISGVLQQNLASLDLPALYWQLQTLNDDNISEFLELNDLVFAMRETSELRLESAQMGAALLKLLRDTAENLEGLCHQVIHETQFNTLDKPLDWVSAFALAAKTVNLTANQALLGYGWAWCETQVAAAIKLVPLGQTQGQTMLNQLITEIANLNDVLLQKMPDIDNLGAISPNLAIISSQHEQQYSRLFRS